VRESNCAISHFFARARCARDTQQLNSMMLQELGEKRDASKYKNIMTVISKQLKKLIIFILEK
jgi:hypothetical protein